MAAVAVGSATDRVSPKLLLLAMALLWSVVQVPAAIGGLAVLVGAGLAWTVAWAAFGADGRHRVAPADARQTSRPAAPYRRILAGRTWIGAPLAYFTS